MKPIVYFSREITPEKVLELYRALGRELPGKIAVKVHSGEEGNQGEENNQGQQNSQGEEEEPADGSSANTGDAFRPAAVVVTLSGAALTAFLLRKKRRCLCVDCVNLFSCPFQFVHVKSLRAVPAGAVPCSVSKHSFPYLLGYYSILCASLSRKNGAESAPPEQ